ncbi:hypothetical protein JM656_13370 [Citrobacter sp. R56]|nr:hypothetical protein JM656_13370 [Citrobacter sp. R56]
MRQDLKKHFTDGFVGGGDSPDFVSKINIDPAGETLFYGADKQAQRQPSALKRFSVESIFPVR